MHMTTPVALLLIFVLSACVEDNNYPDRYFDYSGNDGCSPANIGHRLGGDYDKYADNSIEGMYAIAAQQNSDCFKNWEFDLSEGLDEIVLNHDPVDETQPNATLVTMRDFQREFSTIAVIKPIIIDLKSISHADKLEQVMTFAVSIREVHGSNIWFTVSPDNIELLNIICPIVSGEFDVMLYRQGGPYCDRQ